MADITAGPGTMGHPAEPAADRPTRRTPPVPSACPGAGGKATGPHPLPDAAAIRAVMVPDAAPPYEDCLTRDDGQERTVLPPGGPSPGSGEQRPGNAGPDRQADSAADGQDAPSGNDHHDPAGRGWPSRFAQVLAESLAGSRPYSQLAPWTTEQARRRIRQLGPMLATGDQPKIRRVLVSSPDHGVLEMTVVVSLGGRVRALAVRLEDRERVARQSGRAVPRAAEGHTLRAPGPASAPGSPAAPWFCTAVEAA